MLSLIYSLLLLILDSMYPWSLLLAMVGLAVSHQTLLQPMLVKLCLHRTRLAACLSYSILQCNFLHDTIYMAGSCHALLLYIIHVSAVSGISAFLCTISWVTRQQCSAVFCHKVTPRLAAVTHLLHVSLLCKRSWCITIFPLVSCFSIASVACQSLCMPCPV